MFETSKLPPFALDYKSRIGPIAASLVIALISAKLYPSIFYMITFIALDETSYLTSLSSFKIAPFLALASGKGMYIRLVRRLKAASSRSKGLLVAPIMSTCGLG